MAQAGAPYRVVGGTLLTPFGSNGNVIRVLRGRASKTPVSTADTSGPSTGGNPTFSNGNYVYRASLMGQYTEAPTAITGVSYTHATKTLSKTGAFASVAVGESIYVSGGTGATAGFYVIATNADANTITLETAPGTGDQSDFAINGITTLAGVDSGPCVIQIGSGEKWSGTVLVTGVTPTANYGDLNVDVIVNVLFTGAVTVTTGAV